MLLWTSLKEVVKFPEQDQRVQRKVWWVECMENEMRVEEGVGLSQTLATKIWNV